MSTTFEFDQSETVENTGGKFIDKAGKYHVLITELDPAPHSKDGSPIDGLRIGIEVLGGSDASQVGRVRDITLYRGKPSDKDKGELANKKLSRLALALGGQHSPGGRGVIDCEKSVGRQIVVEVGPRTGNDGKTYMDLSYAEIYHVDDPTVAGVPKNSDAIALIEAADRKINQAANSATAKPAPVVTTNAAATTASVALDDI